MKIADAIQEAARRLEKAGVEEARVDSEFLVAAALQCSRPALALHHADEMPPASTDLLNRWVAERARRKPLGYVLGEQPFMDLILKVDPAVLLPRPETELLVEKALRRLDEMERPVWIVDVGTGSGNIALCLARHPRAARVTGIDLSPEALKVARENAERYHLQTRCEWREGHLLSPLTGHAEKPGMILANLPYVRSEDIAALESELHWEPRRALDGGPDGLQLIFELIRQAEEILAPEGFLFLEIGADQDKAVLSCLHESGRWNSIYMTRDLAGWPRVIQARRLGD